MTEYLVKVYEGNAPSLIFTSQAKQECLEFIEAEKFNYCELWIDDNEYYCVIDRFYEGVIRP